MEQRYQAPSLREPDKVLGMKSIRTLASELKDKLERLGSPRVHQISRPMDDAKLSKIVESILKFFTVVPPFYDPKVAEPLQIRGAWKAILAETRPSQIAAINNNDVASYSFLLHNFFRTELIHGLWNYGNSPSWFVAPNLVREVRTFEIETGRSPRDLLPAGAIHSAWGWKVDEQSDAVVTNVAPSHGRQASHILNALAFLEGTSKSKPLNVLDIGSGFGGTALFLAEWSAWPLRIVLLDIPLNLANAYAYLRIAAPDLRVKLISDVEDLEAEVQAKGISALADETSLLLVPTIYSEAVAEIFPPDLVHNAQSFGEMDLDTIDYYLQTLVRPSTRVIIESNASTFGATSLFGHFEIGNEEISVILRELGFDLIARHARDSWARYAVSTFLRLS